MGVFPLEKTLEIRLSKMPAAHPQPRPRPRRAERRSTTVHNTLDIPYQGTASPLQSLSTAILSVPICRVISCCPCTPSSSNASSSWPSKMPLDMGFETVSLRTILVARRGVNHGCERNVIWKGGMGASTHRYALGLRPATCCTLRSNCPWRKCSRLKAPSSTGVSADNEPSVEPEQNAWVS